MNNDELLINNRVCPKPQVWNKIWNLIQHESKEKVSAPLILAAWHFTSDEEKKNRFLYHLHKAEQLKITEKIMPLLSVPESEWHHENE